MNELSSRTAGLGKEGGVATAEFHVGEELNWNFAWTCEKWDQDKVDFVLAQMERERDSRLCYSDGGVVLAHNISGEDVWRPIEDGLPSEILREYGVEADEILVVSGNLLVNEGIQRLLDLLIAAGGVSYNNASAFVGVGDSATAEAASQVELQAATNRFYKGMVASYPQRTSQTVDWRSDFTSTEANYAWQEWSISSGATTASGAGFTSGTTNLNRKVQSLGTKTTGTWTLTGSVTIS